MRDPERIEAMGRRAREKVVEKFSRDREADEISAVYRRVWGGAGALGIEGLSARAGGALNPRACRPPLSA